MQLPLENLTWNGGEDMVVFEEFETALYDLINSVTPWNKMESWKEMIFIQSKVYIVTRISYRLLITHAYGAKLQIMLEFAPVLYLNKRTISFLFTLDVDSALCSFFYSN